MPYSDGHYFETWPSDTPPMGQPCARAAGLLPPTLEAPSPDALLALMEEDAEVAQYREDQLQAEAEREAELAVERWFEHRGGTYVCYCGKGEPGICC